MGVVSMLGLKLQMSMGIRFLDIRCRNLNDYLNDLPLHHGIYFLDCCFNDVLRIVTEYLNKHPNEFFLINVQEEDVYNTPETGTETFAQKVNRHLADFSDFIYNGELKNPTVADMRGKIIILAHYNQHSPYLGWGAFIVENHWENTKEGKIKDIKNNLDNARQGNRKSLYLTFTNYTEWSTTPKLSSNSVNQEVHSYARSKTGRLGLIAMDYPGPKLIRDIINHN